MQIAMVAADYTPGEADQLRRDMAAWKRSGRLEQHEQRLITRMMAKGITREFAERIFRQIQGFGEYGFPESHAASFALISYAASYLRCHHPSEFVCSLLNAQPMGFYSIATIVEDAKRMGVEVRPVDARRSQWHCTLERIGEAGSPESPAGEEGRSGVPARRLAVRMGLRFVKTVSEASGARVMKARGEGGQFTSIENLARRTGMADRELASLAKAGAFDATGLSRRAALWDVPAAARTANLSLPFDDDIESPAFEAIDEAETITWDYQAASHSTHGHPVASLRPMLRAKGIPDAQTVRGLQDGSSVRYAGLVICRQRPQTAKNVTFMTLEDETGFVNLVIWQRVFDEYSLLARTAHWLGVSGRIQSQHGVVHVVAEELWTPRDIAVPEHLGSRDFH